MFSPTTAIVASPFSARIGNMAPVSISLANSSLSTFTAASESDSFMPIEVEFSDEAWLTINTDMPLFANAVNILRFTPITPTIDKPVTVINAVPLMLEIPFMALVSLFISFFIMVPGFFGLKVFFTLIGMFFMHTG